MRLKYRQLLAAASLGFVGTVVAQPGQNLPVELTDGPAAPGFDIERFSNAGNGWFETYYVEQTDDLRQALSDGRLSGDTRMMISETAGYNLALDTDQMAYHHLAQGTVEGQHWLATF